MGWLLIRDQHFTGQGRESNTFRPSTEIKSQGSHVIYVSIDFLCFGRCVAGSTLVRC